MFYLRNIKCRINMMFTVCSNSDRLINTVNATKHSAVLSAHFDVFCLRDFLIYLHIHAHLFHEYAFITNANISRSHDLLKRLSQISDVQKPFVYRSAIVHPCDVGLPMSGLAFSVYPRNLHRMLFDARHFARKSSRHVVRSTAKRNG